MSAQKKRLALIGPILPFRGGISQHTTMLHRTLKQQADLLTISFSRQYPAWLYPGESDRDPSYEGYTESGVNYIIDSINPLTWYRAAKICLEHRPDMVIIPWWTVFWAPCFWYLARKFRKAGIEVVFFCHNVVEHESAAWKTFLTRKVLKEGMRFVVHTREDKSNLLALLPYADVTIFPHPIYEQFPEPRGVLKRRAGLELLFFGFVRPYKGLDILIDAMRDLHDQDIYLTIAGEFWGGEEETRREIVQSGLKDKIEIRSEYLPEQEVAELFHRADIVVLPYRTATGSGIVPLAYHYIKPVIVTQVGGLPDVVINGKTGFIIPPCSPESLVKIIKMISIENLLGMRSSISEFKEKMGWDGLVKNILGEDKMLNNEKVEISG
ncbi:MAG TPA: glycosyltransferase [Gammaproteobacteria bacterium]|nr:glycosyltransferase [Gammaproteobacteria bacterium]